MLACRFPAECGCLALEEHLPVMPRPPAVQHQQVVWHSRAVWQLPELGLPAAPPP